MSNTSLLKRKARARRTHVQTRKSGRVRLIVFKSNTAIYAQICDDSAGKVLAGESSLKLGKKNKENAEKVGKAIAKKAVAAGIKEVVFDRNGFFYKGNVKALADGARSEGLSF